MAVLNHSPNYSSKLMEINESCVRVPIPKLQHYNEASTVNTTSSTVINWPPTDDSYRLLDIYLGNCVTKGYCSPFDNVCHSKLEDGQQCNSTNQCLDSQCVDGQCRYEWNLWSAAESSEQSSSGFNAIHLIAGVVGIIVLIIIITVSALIYRRRRRVQQQRKGHNLPLSSSYPPSPSTGLGTHYANPRALSFTTFANDFNQPTSNVGYQAACSEHNNNYRETPTSPGSTSTMSPTMQQLQLQLRLQQELRYQEVQQHQSLMTTLEGTRLKESSPPPYQP
jgi:hypothetical protein